MKPNPRQVVLRPFRSRFYGRIFGLVFIVMMMANAIYVSRQTRLYEAIGELEIPMPAIHSVENVVDTSLSCGVDMNTVQEVMASQHMLRKVIDRLDPEDRSLFLRPYGGIPDHSDEMIKRLIIENRTMKLNRKMLKWEMRYRHPDRHMSSRIVDLFLNEGVAYETRARMDQDAYVVQFLKQRAQQSEQQVEVSDRAVVTYRETRQDLNDRELEKDERYQALIKKAETEKNLNKMILERISRVNASAKNETNCWRISQSPSTPGEDDYLLVPLIVTAAWGSAIAVIAGVLAVVVFKLRAVSTKTGMGHV